MKSSKFLIAVICIVEFTFLPPFGENKVVCQDIHYSQFYVTQVLYNPAVAGTFDRNYRFMADYRNQWGSISTPFVTMSGAFDMWFTKNKSICGGLTFYNDKAGDSKMGTTQVNLLVSTVQKVNDMNLISAGVQAGYVQNSITYSNLTWDSQYQYGVYNSALPSNEPNAGSDQLTRIDVGAGAYWMLKASNEFKINTGLGFHHLNFPKYSFPAYNTSKEKQDIRLVLHSHAQYDIKRSNTSILPNLLIQQQGKSREILAGMMVKYILGMTSRYTGAYQASALYFGGFYRTGDAFIAAIMFDWEKYLTAGFSYDINLSSLTAATSSLGGMEITMHIPVSSSNQRSSAKLK